MVENNRSTDLLPTNERTGQMPLKTRTGTYISTVPPDRRWCPLSANERVRVRGCDWAMISAIGTPATI